MKWLKSIYSKTIGRLFNTSPQKSIPQKDREVIQKISQEILSIIDQKSTEKPDLYYKIIKLTTGEQLIAKIPFFPKTNTPIINNGFVTLINPLVFRMYYQPSVNMMVQEEFILEDWIKLGNNQAELLDASKIVVMADPHKNIVNMYNYNVLRSTLYKAHPHIAQHIYELSICGSHPMVNMNDDDENDQPTF